MPVKEKEREITIFDRRWKIKKFDALTGSYIALKLMSKLSHIAFELASGNKINTVVVAMSIATEIGTLSKQEFREIQEECLHVCSLIQVVGEQTLDAPLRLPNGRWAVGDLEDDSLLVMTLISHVLLFNMTSFFDGNALKESAKTFEGLIPFDVQT